MDNMFEMVKRNIQLKILLLSYATEKGLTLEQAKKHLEEATKALISNIIEKEENE